MNGRPLPRNLRHQRGAVAVEFALVLPLLLALVLGIVEFGRIYNAQVLVTNAAREAARTMAVQNNWTTAKNHAQAVAPGYSLSFSPDPATCTSGSEVQVKVSTPVTTISGSWFGLGSTVTVSGTGAMLCGG